MSWKKIGTTILYPPRWSKIFLLILSFASLTTIMAAGLALTHELALYYITLAYLVVVLTAYFIKEFPRKKMFVEKTLSDTPTNEFVGFLELSFYDNYLMSTQIHR